MTGAPLAPTVFGLGTATANVALGGGCSLLVGSPIGAVFLVADGVGDAALTLAVPPDLSFVGVELIAQ